METPKNLPTAPPSGRWEKEAWQMTAACLRQLIILSAEIDGLLQTAAKLAEKYPAAPADSCPLQESKQP
ncbi:MAG: hypothetical protein HFE45_06150 [Oscillospiraceae bacterium]|mgnify:CR=1 FL=1|jgi:hypothetical protein|nr:hypothetical protein [Oscillospiraceae bacterium]